MDNEQQQAPATYAEIKDRVEKNIEQGYGVPFEWLRKMTETLDLQQRAMEEMGAQFYGYRSSLHKALGCENDALGAVKRIAQLRRAEEQLQDARARLPAETDVEERQRLRKQQAMEAALQVCQYLVEHKTDMMGRLDFSSEPVERLFMYFGYSYAEYEGA